MLKENYRSADDENFFPFFNMDLELLANIDLKYSFERETKKVIIRSGNLNHVFFNRIFEGMERHGLINNTDSDKDIEIDILADFYHPETEYGNRRGINKLYDYYKERCDSKIAAVKNELKEPKKNKTEEKPSLRNDSFHFIATDKLIDMHLIHNESDILRNALLIPLKKLLGITLELFQEKFFRVAL